MTQFLKSSEVSVKNGGYLFNNNGQPVSNKEFEEIQRRAEFIVTFNQKLKGKDLVGKKPENIQDIKNEVLRELSKSNNVQFLSKPEKVDRPLTDQLTSEALDFIKFQDDSSKTDKINQFLQPFKVLKQFQEFGLFFENGIAELNKIYTLEEVIDSVTDIIDYV